MILKSIINNFISSEKDYPYLSVFTAGLYPFLHYFNSNLHIANSWQQLVFMVILCFIAPLVLLWLSKFIFKWDYLKSYQPYRLTILNMTVFLGLIVLLVLSLNKKATVLLIGLTIIIACMLGRFLFKHLKKIVILQFIMAAISGFTLLPILSFALKQSNEDWATVSNSLLEAKFKFTPNIFVIQPDGYANRSEMNKQPYSYDNSSFYDYLDAEKFTYYDHFRSNYYSTMTSNSSMFAMKHHYYSNTYENLKTFNANNAIIGGHSNALKILKNNNYKTHLITDNSYFLIDRELSIYDYCNVKPLQVSFIDTGSVNRNILEDFGSVLDTLKSSKNFFFIEKTIPSHIMYLKSKSFGVEKERKLYLEKVQQTNEWLKNLIKKIKEYDDDALIIIVADHGGFVGLNYTMEAVNKELNAEETRSVFTSMLSIKWPSNIASHELEFNSNVNLFRTVFYSLSHNEEFLKTKEPNYSYIPLYENGIANYYKCIDDKGHIVFDKIRIK